MSITLYGLKNCDTCKKALKSLEAAGQDVLFVDIRADADHSIKVPLWLTAVGVDTLINKRSTTWRTLSDVERSADPKALLMGNPTLIKRPVLECGSDVYVGWTKSVQQALL